MGWTRTVLSALCIYGYDRIQGNNGRGWEEERGQKELISISSLVPSVFAATVAPMTVVEMSTQLHPDGVLGNDANLMNFRGWEDQSGVQLFAS